MKILMNALSARKGGILTYTQNLKTKFSQAGIKTTIAHPKYSPIAEEGKTISMNVNNMSALERFLWEQTIWRRQVNKIRPDILFSSANFALFGCKMPQLLLMREGGLFNPFYIQNVFPKLGRKARITTVIRRNLMVQSIKAATNVMVPSKTLCNWIQTFCPALKTKVKINTYGINLDFFKAQNSTPLSVSDPVNLLYVSVYYPHKDPETLKKATTLLRQKNIDVQTHITMSKEEFDPWHCGKKDYQSLTTPEVSEYLELSSVKYENLPDVYAKNDIFVFPSVSETFGFPLVEAMATGIPVIAADSSINREICGDAALYFRPYDAQELAKKINSIRTQPNLYNSLCKKGIELANQKYSINQHFENLIEIFKRMHTENGLSD